MKKILIVLAIFVIFFPVKVFASEPDYDYTEINEITKEYDMDFEEVVNKFIEGDVKGALNELWEGIKGELFGELFGQKELLIKIVTIGVIASVFSNISGAFISSNISETAFYLTFTALLGMLVSGYVLIANIVTEALSALLELMEAIVPVYVLSLGFSTGQASATGAYQIIAMAITFVEKIIQTIVLPLVYAYMIAGVMNNLINGSFLTKACELLKNIVNWILKGLMSVIIGINVIQGLITPIVDSLKASALGKAAGMIPGIGNSLSSMSGVILGSGTLIKNSIGMAAMIAIIVLVFSPVVKSLIMSLAYKVASAVLEPVSDKRVINVITAVYESVSMLVKTLLYAVVFFMLTIAIVCSTTNFNVK